METLVLGRDCLTLPPQNESPSKVVDGMGNLDHGAIVRFYEKVAHVEVIGHSS